MATPPIPDLFLSHSGAQKDFTRRLYRELLHVNHNPFFDQDARDSLPKGEPFPSRIVEACRACKLGIVVVSHEYIVSLWPMLELQQLFFHNPSSPNNVYPIFYQLKPSDLSKEDNLRQWQSAWEKKAPSWHTKMQDMHMAASGTSTSCLQPMLDISSWPKALAMLRYQSGESNHKDEHAFIQDIVSNICKRLPPPESFLMGDHFKGAEHIQQEIHELFQQQQRDEESDDPRRTPIVVGVYGVGGSGKTTLCNYMLNFYNKEYPGSCCFLQFPSREEDESELIQSMKDIISTRGNLANETFVKIKSVEQAMSHLQGLLKRYRVFLVLDNVWDWALQRAKQIVTMDYMHRSRLLVTSRSEGLLQTLSSSIRIHVNEVVGRLPAMQIIHVPSISEEEAIEALMAYSLMCSQYATSAEEMRGLARSCFFGEQCHPLLLQAMGAKLRHLGGHIRSARDWTRLISRLQALRIYDDKQIEDTVINVLKTSFDALDTELQKTFLNLGTCIPKRLWKNELRSEWLSILSHITIEDVRDQLVELEYHGLIYDEGVVIHDLQLMLIEKIVRENNGAPRCFLFEGDVATLSASELTRLRYIHGVIGNSFDLTSLEEGSTDLTVLSPQRSCLEQILIGCFPFAVRAASSNPLDIEVLCLQSKNFECWVDVTQRFSLKHMQSLRYLLLSNIQILKELGGWHGAPNLVSVKLLWCKNLESIESMSCLPRLESLVIEDCQSTGQYVTNLSSSKNLKRLVIENNDHVECLGSLGHLPNLEELDLSYCQNLVDVGTLSDFTSLQRCNLTKTGIRKFPDFSSINLRVLILSECERLQSMEGDVCGLTALEGLYFQGCHNLECIPDLRLLAKLSILILDECHALKEVKLGDAALTSIDMLAIQYSCVISSMSMSMSCSALPFSAFTNLWRLVARGDKWGNGNLTLDVSLVDLTLDNSETTEEITCLSTLVNLRKLCVKKWQSLTKITGLGPLTKLVSLKVYNCASLREVGHWEAPFISNLEYVHIWDCPKLETLSTMRHLTSLKDFYIGKCPMVQVETLPIQNYHGL